MTHMNITKPETYFNVHHYSEMQHISTNKRTNSEAVLDKRYP